jgi:hypothetical protein
MGSNTRDHSLDASYSLSRQLNSIVWIGDLSSHDPDWATALLSILLVFGWRKTARFPD